MMAREHVRGRLRDALTVPPYPDRIAGNKAGEEDETFLSVERQPSVVVLAGPNGAGKSTTAPALLRDVLAVTEFVNADTIAQGLSGFDPDSSALEAGRIMLRRVRELAGRREDFAFETTLASRSFAPWLRELKQGGYRVNLLFLWLPSPDFAVERVAERVRMGGHDILEDVIRRRYRKGLQHFFALYRPICDVWRVYDNSDARGPRLVSAGSGPKTTQVLDARTWQLIEEHSDAK
jgi:predicted ABC-type ATPase